VGLLLSPYPKKLPNNYFWGLEKMEGYLSMNTNQGETTCQAWGVWIDEVHFKAKLIGSARKIAFFNSMLTEFDRDWPYGPPEKKRYVRTCEKCDGLIYQNPRFNPKQLLQLSKQVNELSDIEGHFKLKILRMCRGKVCREGKKK